MINKLVETPLDKSDLIQAIAYKSGLSKRGSDILIDSMSSQLASGGRIEVRGFGSFVMREYKAYEGRNPKTGEKIHIEAKRLPFFNTGKDLTNRINS